MHCDRRTFTMVHSVSLLLLVVAAASAAAELDLQFIICETYTEGVTDGHGKGIELPSYRMPPEQNSITIPVPRIWSNGCLANGVKAKVCHARVNYFNTNLDMKTLKVSRLPIPVPRGYEVIITITSYCSGLRPTPKANVLPKLWE